MDACKGTWLCNVLGEVLHEELLQAWQGTKAAAFGSPVMSAPPLHAGGEGAACRQLNPPAAWRSPRGCCPQVAGQRLPLCGTRGRKAQAVTGLDTAVMHGTQRPGKQLQFPCTRPHSQIAHLPAPHVQLSEGEGCV